MYKAAVISLFIGLVVANRDIIEHQQTGVAKTSFQRVVKLQQAGVKKTSFCNRSDCPTFTEVQDFGNFEERRYSPSVWATTTLSGTDYRKTRRQMFMKLFRYIQGKNVDGMKIKMTVPVKTRIIPGQGRENNFTMSFFISPKVTNPPKAIDDSIVIEEIPEQTVYVKEFGGYARNYEAWKDQALALAAELKTKDLVDYEMDDFYSCGYTSPWKRSNRHNEVWFLKK